MELLEQVLAILDEYAEQLPLTARQVFYRLVGAWRFDKSEKAYNRLLNILNRGRRAGRIPFGAIRDDGPRMIVPPSYASPSDFLERVRGAASNYRIDRQLGQAQYIELWCEAAGMLPQLARIVEEYSIPVFSSGGFDSLTAKKEAADRIAGREMPTNVLHIGDLDPSGCSVFDSLAEDVPALVLSDAPVTFVRLAVTPDHVAKYDLPEAPPKKTDNRGAFEGQTVQAEALAPDELEAEVRESIADLIDATVHQATLGVEAEHRAELREFFDEDEAEAG